MHDQRVTCAVCGKDSDQTVLTSTNMFGSPDLDLRPGEMQRSTMTLWVQACPHCTFAAPDIGCATSGEKAVVQSAAYAGIGSHMPDLARRFLRRAHIEEQLGNLRLAAFSTLHAAWHLDDRGEAAKAQDLRRQAAQLLGAHLCRSAKDGDGATIQDRVRLIDMLRRAGERNEAARIVANLRKEKLEPLIVRIVDFQSDLIDRCDEGCYTVADATRAGGARKSP
jgi:hypothetical protein